MVTAEATLVPITQEQEQAIDVKRTSLVEAAEGLVIDDSDSEAVAWGIVNRIGELKKTIVTDFEKSKKAAHGAWKAICEQEAGHLLRLREPDNIVRGKLSAWDDEKTRILREAQAAQQAEVDRQAAEANRIAREKAEREAEEQRIQDALAAEAAGDKEQAKALLEAPIEVAPVEEVVAPFVPQMVIPKVAGQGAMVTTWKFEIVDPKQVPDQYKVVDEKAIRRVVDALRDRASIPGVRVYSVQEPRRSGRKPTERWRRNDGSLA